MESTGNGPTLRSGFPGGLVTLTALVLAAPAFAGEPCASDLNGDGGVDTADLGILLGDFGCTPAYNGPCAVSEPNGNGIPGCSADPVCEEIVCANDPFCCSAQWDDLCATQAMVLCEPTDCTADLSGDGFVDTTDLGILLGDFGCTPDLFCGSSFAGSCCEANGTPFCNDAACCELICAGDPFCCATEWDEFCASTALDHCVGCLECGSPAAGSCCLPSGTPFCEDAACCEVICAQDPFCCEVQWDDVCASAAATLCGALCAVTGACCLGDGTCVEGLPQNCFDSGGTYQGDGTTCAETNCPPPPACGNADTGDCCTGNGTPFCDDADCCEAICAVDPFCCNATWDNTCATQAVQTCTACGVAPACGVVGTGSCCDANGTPFCDDAQCCEAVCAVDPFCCDTEWDTNCVDTTVGLCGDLCDTTVTGACCLGGGPCEEGPEQNCIDNGGVYQGDGTTCAGIECPIPSGCGEAGTGDCCVANGTPFCTIAGCCAAVCAQDPFCCEFQWDTFCADLAIATCSLCAP